MGDSRQTFRDGQDFINKMLIVYAQNNEAFTRTAKGFYARRSKIKRLREIDHSSERTTDVALSAKPPLAKKKSAVRPSSMRRQKRVDSEQSTVSDRRQGWSFQKRQGSLGNSSFISLTPSQVKPVNWMSTFDRIEKAS